MNITSLMMDMHQDEQSLLNRVYEDIYGEKVNKAISKNFMKDFSALNSYVDIIQKNNIKYPDFVKYHVGKNNELKEEISKNLIHWMIDAAQWLNDPNNGKKAYLFVDSHPMNWQFHYHGEGIKTFAKDYSHTVKDFNPFEYAQNVEIEYDKGAHHVIDGVNFDKNGNPCVMLEMGVESIIRGRGLHDYYLDIYEPTVNESFTALAHILFYSFDITGMDRPDKAKENYYEYLKEIKGLEVNNAIQELIEDENNLDQTENLK